MAKSVHTRAPGSEQAGNSSEASDRFGPVILDCTIRDGSYAIDFKFTADDTALVAGLLEGAGITYIEVGHGLGLGASEAGKGTAASHDIEVIERTRDQVRDAQIGAFFIPGIGEERNLREAAAAGMDFVRIGQNADEIVDAWPFVELARGLGLQVFVNFMKTYGITPESFAEAARQAESLGAHGVYVVDSAGGMLPHEVRGYVSATLERSDIHVGFHGHSNLHLAVANSLAAFEAGASFVDTSVYGIGRSSGNVPTEVMAAVFDRHGIDCGVDAFRVIDIAESYLKPLAEHLHPHDMIAVSLGFGRFHSSYLTRALEAAEAAGVNPFRLIVELGRRDMMRLGDDLLQEVVAELEGVSAKPEVRLDIARFSDPRFGPLTIGNRPQALGELLDGLEVVAAKRHLDVVVDLVPTPTLDEETVTAEFVLEDEFAALGRLRFGSVAAAVAAISGHGQRVNFALLDLEGVDAHTVSRCVGSLAAVLPNAILPYSSAELELDYLGDAALSMVAGLPAQEVLVCDPGFYSRSQVRTLMARLEAAAHVDWANSDRPFPRASLVVVAGPAESVRDPGADAEATLYIGRSGWNVALEPGPGSVMLRREDAYRDALPRWKRGAAASRVLAAPRPVA